MHNDEYFDFTILCFFKNVYTQYNCYIIEKNGVATLVNFGDIFCIKLREDNCSLWDIFNTFSK
jgi:hypothetical protein